MITAARSEGFEQLVSEQDASVNFVEHVGEGEALESRFVWRGGHYFTCYLSSQTACAQACRMCWLTQTGQNRGRDATFDELREQARRVLKHYDAIPSQLSDVLFSFMARGEPLASSSILFRAESVFRMLRDEAADSNLRPHICISTIMPETLRGYALSHVFPETYPDLYYSVYSMRHEFRRRWLPNAMDPLRALDMLAAWQEHSRKLVTLHWAPIRGECDHATDVEAIIEAVESRGLRCDVNLVRYNPIGPRLGSESPNLGAIALQIQYRWPQARVKVVSRVGSDVAASCGMFVQRGRAVSE